MGSKQFQRRGEGQGGEGEQLCCLQACPLGPLPGLGGGDAQRLRHVHSCRHSRLAALVPLCKKRPCRAGRSCPQCTTSSSAPAASCVSPQEVEKLHWATIWGADTIMDLSVG